MDRLTVLGYNKIMEYTKLSDLRIHERHCHVNAIPPLMASIQKFGFNNCLKVWRGFIIAGSHSYRALLALQQQGASLPSGQGVRLAEDGEWEIATINASHLTEQMALAYMLADNNLQRTGYDDQERLNSLISELPADLVDVAGYSHYDLQQMIGEGEEESNSTEDLLPETEPVVKPGYVPDVIWPSTNEFGVPDLLPDLQGDAILPPKIAKWGSQARTANHEQGLYHFYVEDYKMSALWDDPTILVNSRCLAVTEPNFSTRPGLPKAVVLYQHIYKKRWLARYWQSHGIKIYVDLNIERDYFDMALWGVPQGWLAYCNRAYANDPTHLEDAYNLAAKHAGTKDVIYLVYGGGQATQATCQKHGWLWLPEEADVVRGRYQEDSYGTRVRQAENSLRG